MAKILAIHLCGVGHQEARFHPLTLRFDRGGVPSAVVVNLRNGGGKTSLLSLIYAVLLPAKNDFLGNVNESHRTLEEYFLPGKLGVVAMEMEQAGSRFVVMIAWVRKERDHQPTLATFKSGPKGIAFSDLPLQGLQAQAASNLAELMKWLQARHGQSPGDVDLFVASNYKEWHSRLRLLRGVDAHLFRSHLTMNRSEGAVDEEFQFNKTSKFIEKYLEFAMETPVGGGEAEDPVTASLNEHRRSLAKLPQYRKEVDFIAAALPLLTELNGLNGLERTAQSERDEAFAQLRILADGVDFLLRSLRETFASNQSLKSSHEATRADLVRKRDNAKRHMEGYERRGKELKLKEATVALADAKKNADAKRRSAAMLAAAKIYREVRGARSELNALTEKRNRIEQALKPDLDLVRERAARLRWAYLDSIKSEQEALADIKAEIDLAKEEIGRLRIAEGETQRVLSDILAKLQSVTDRIAHASRARQILVDERILEPREGAAVALARHTEENVRHDNAAGTARATASAARTSAGERRNRAAGLRKTAATAGKEAAAARADIARFDAAVAACGANPEVLNALEGGSFDPFNEGVVPALQARERVIRQECLNLAISSSEDRRIIESYNPVGNSLFPPPREIAELVQRLKGENIPAVLSAYEWLAQNTAGTDQALAMLRSDPATYSGIVANTPEALEAAERLLASHSLTRPVKITLAATLRSEMKVANVVVVPERCGFFNAAAAKVEFASVDESHRHQDEKIREREADASRFATAADRVAGLQNDFPKTWLDGRRSALEVQDRLATESEAGALAEDKEAEAADRRAVDSDRLATEHAMTASEARNAATRVREFIQSFGSHLDGWLREERSYTEKRDVADADHRRIQGQISPLEDSITAAEERRQAANSRRATLEAQFAVAGLAPYITTEDERVDHGDAVEEAPLFQAAREVYEDKAREQSVAQEIAAATKLLTEAEGRFNRGRGDATETEISPLSVFPDLDDKALQSESVARLAEGKLAVATSALESAERDVPRSQTLNEREDMDPGLPKPQTSSEADALKLQKAELHEEMRRQADAARDDMLAAEQAAKDAESAIEQYESILALLAPAKPENPVQTASLVGKPGEDRVQVMESKRRFEAAVTRSTEIVRKRDKLHEQRLDPLVKHEQWDGFQAEVREKLRRFSRDELNAGADQLVRDCQERNAGLVAKLAEIDKVRETLVDQLYAKASEALRLLNRAARFSTMPTGLGAWSGQPFLRIPPPTLPSQDERRTILRGLMERWMVASKADMAIPRGAALAFECLMAVMNQKEITIEILKPEAGDPTVCNYQPVTKLASFSGGQRVTAAILLYCVIVRVRSEQGDLLNDCGFLLLDNPFGKASHFPLIELQLRMAEAMGVQLVYMTGINDFEALSSFPLRIRLRNAARNASGGERLVQLEPHTVEAVRHYRTSGT